MNYFDEKSQQVDVSSLSAFEISISTRYGKAHELVEMLLFAREVAKNNLHGLIKSIFYDSNSRCCTFEFTKQLSLGVQDERILLAAAKKTISQFEWFGSIEHGAKQQVKSDQWG